MSDHWYYAKNNREHGPVEFSKLQQIATSGELLPSDLVWTDSMEDWATAESIEALSFVATEKVSHKCRSFLCPHCAVNIAVPTSFKKDHATCPGCSKSVEIPGGEVDEIRTPAISEEPGEWYYAKDDRQHGPFKFRKLQRMASSGEFGPSDLVWNQMMEDWVTAASVEDLSFGQTDSLGSKSSEPKGRSSGQSDEQESYWTTARAWLPIAAVAVAAIALLLIGWAGTIQLILLGVIVALLCFAIYCARDRASNDDADDETEFKWFLGILIGMILACTLTLTTHWLGWRVPFLISVWTSIVATAATAGLAVLGTSEEKDPTQKQETKVLGGVLTGLCVLLLLAAFSLSQYRPPFLPVEDLSKASLVVIVSWHERDIAREQQLHGSAFVYDAKADKLRVFTNSHCLGLTEIVESVSQQTDPTANITKFKVNVRFPSGKIRPAERIGESTNPSIDAGCIEVSAQGLVEGRDFVLVSAVEDALENLEVHPGNEVIAVGAPLDLQLAGTQTFGRVSAIRVFKDDPEKAKWIQHDATLASGNSGGPLFLRDGDKAYWIGINTIGIDGTSMSLALASEQAVGVEYKWADANPNGAAELINKVHGVAAVVGDQRPPLASLHPPKSVFQRLPQLKLKEGTTMYKRPSFFNRLFQSEFPFINFKDSGPFWACLIFLIARGLGFLSSGDETKTNATKSDVKLD